MAKAGASSQRVQAAWRERRRGAPCAEKRPDVAAEFDAPIAVNKRGDRPAAERAFAERARDRGRRAGRERRRGAIWSRSAAPHTEATLLYPFQARSGARLCEAAELRRTTFWYWIECGRARSRSAARAAPGRLRTRPRTRQRRRLSATSRRRLTDLGDGASPRATSPAPSPPTTRAWHRPRPCRPRPGQPGWARDVSVSLEQDRRRARRPGRPRRPLAAFDESLASPPTSPPATRATPAGPATSRSA